MQKDAVVPPPRWLASRRRFLISIVTGESNCVYYIIKKFDYEENIRTETLKRRFLLSTVTGVPNYVY